MRHGFLLVHKPKGPTSHDLVGMVRRTLSEPSIGHLGTLDPMAEGLMVLAVGSKALKVIELFSKMTKEYDAEVTLGKDSTTYDAEGLITVHDTRPGYEPPTDQSRVQTVLNERFVGTVDQVPPIFSAIKVGGSRAYRKAQRGESVELKSRPVSITECRILSYNYPLLSLHVACGSGTYIRSLAHDIGETLRSGGYLSKLVRTKVGEWLLTDAVQPDSVAWGHVLPLKSVLSLMPRRELSDAEMIEIQHGRSVMGIMPSEGTPIAWHKDLPVAILERNPKKQGMLKPRKVL
ncbi:MAG: tRNA pseudouridine(55) synthase TruB [Candidatus Peribacteraceae bacterium]